MAYAPLPSFLPALTALSDEVRAGRLITARALEQIMVTAVGATSASGAWDWRTAYDVIEGAMALSALKDSGCDASPDETLSRLTHAVSMVPTQSKRSEAQLRLQQFSTPLPYAWLVAQAAALTSEDFVLEPSAGTGLVAVMAKRAGAHLHVNEIDPHRCAILSHALGVTPSSHDAAQIDDLLDRAVQPTVIMMNPPFSSSFDRAHDKDMACRHLFAALKRLVPGGRLVAIMPDSFSAERRPAFWTAIEDRAVFRLRLKVPGSVYRKHGTTVDTCLVVIDKITADGGETIFASVDDLASALPVLQELPPRAEAVPVAVAPAIPPKRAHRKPMSKPRRVRVSKASQPTAPTPLTYTGLDLPRVNAPISDIYASYAPQRIEIADAKLHPTPLVESLAMASVAPPQPTAKPVLPPKLISDGNLSDAQLETAIYAADAHERFLPGHWRVSDDLMEVTPCAADAPDAVRYRTGFFCGDGTGCGKGRQVGSIILDNWLQGRRKALWISKSETLLQDAIRDWTDLGGSPTDIRLLGKWKPDESIGLSQGILFTTYATLRSVSQHGRSRLDQIIEWLGRDFDGVIAFDEAHAMGNAAGGEGARGPSTPSLQGIAGLRLQTALPGARVLYVSATGATTVENLAYATRLGLWGQDAAYPFPSRESFVSAMLAGGTAAMEVVARDLKALGLYLARSLSFEGVECEMLDHPLTPRQREIYDAWADAFQIIHANLAKALIVTNVDDVDGKSQNGQRKSAVMSRFESLKQRFFNHLLTGMMTPSVIEAIRRDLELGASAVIQIVTTGEALLTRRLDGVSEAERADLNLDLTPREYVLDYLESAFPVELQRVIEDGDGVVTTETVLDEITGAPVLSREAEAMRDALICQLGALDSVTTAIDQVLWAFGPDAVAEITGRKQRPVFRGEGDLRKLVIESRPASSNAAETKAFMDGGKRILIFSEAGGTGRSYHAAHTALNQDRRHHYLLEPGWRADGAIQGLGRTHRSAQMSAPLYRVPATDVQGQKRFTSTIARRLDTLGALTKGERQTGSQGLFRAEDNLESPLARSALRAFLAAIAMGNADSITYARFETITGLLLYTSDGALRDDLPPMSRFLNRVLALRIDDQNAIFDELGGLIAARTEAARAAGTLDVGIEEIRADRLVSVDRAVIRTCEITGAETVLNHLRRTDRLTYASGTAVVAGRSSTNRLFTHRTTGEPVIRKVARSMIEDDGTTVPQYLLVAPEDDRYVTRSSWADVDWIEAAPEAFETAWDRFVADLPTVTHSDLYLLTGLLIPIWKHLPTGEQRIWRGTPEGSSALLGPALTDAQAAALKGRLAPSMIVDPASVLAAVTTESRRIALDQGAALKLRRVGMSDRLEIENAPHELIGTLKALGCFTEIIQYRTRVFVPFGGDAETLRILTAALSVLPISDDTEGFAQAA